MELANIIFKSFFYPFLIGIILSILIVSILLSLFTNNYYDKRSAQNAINFEINSAKMKLKSANIILSSTLLKIQAALNEQILIYQKMANKIKNIDDISTLNLNEENFKAIYDLTKNYLNETKEKLDYMAFWYIDNKSRNFDDIKDIRTKKQIIAYSNIIHNIYSSLAANSKINSIYEYYLYLEETNLYLAFPITYFSEADYLVYFQNYFENPYWCTNDKGEAITNYYVKCREFYINILKAKINTFDINPLKNTNNRTIFVTNFYRQLSLEGNDFIYTIYIQFLDPITNGNGYVCCDVNQNELNIVFDNINLDTLGYYFTITVGFNNVFYFPQGNDYPKTITDNIYKWNLDFFLKEKEYFFNDIQKLFTSDYINQLGEELYEAVNIEGKNSTERYFNISNKKYYYEIIPVILENLNGYKEHVYIFIIMNHI